MDSLLTPHYSLLILSKAIGLCACSVRRLMPKSESEPSNKNKNFISPARTNESATRPLPSCKKCKMGVFLVTWSHLIFALTSFHILGISFIVYRLKLNEVRRKTLNEITILRWSVIAKLKSLNVKVGSINYVELIFEWI